MTYSASEMMTVAAARALSDDDICNDLLIFMLAGHDTTATALTYALWALGHDPFLIHFLHRWWAWVVVALLVVLARRVRRTARGASVAVHSAFGTQILLGIATVWSGVALWLAVLHQTVGALLVAATVWAVHALGRPRKSQG